MNNRLPLAVASVVLLFAACGHDSGPTAPGTSCAALAGVWTVHISNSCAQNFSEQVAVIQTGCDISGILSGGDGFTGHINGSQIDFVVTSGCGSGNGTATINNSTNISGSFAGQITRTGCTCPVGPYSGSFSLTR